METRRLGGLFDGETRHQAGSVWDKEFVSPTIDTMQGGYREPMIIDDTQGFEDKPRIYDKYAPVLRSERTGLKTIVAMRGRNPDNPSDRTVGAPTEQRLEPNSQGICNTLTSVQKDNLVMESVRIKQATKEGYIECKVGGVADLSFPSSKTRRGRVQDNGDTCPTLMAGESDICRIEKNERFFEQAIRILETGDCEIGDCVDAFNGRVNKSGLSPTITTRPEGFKTAILPVVQDKVNTNRNGCVDCDSCIHRTEDCLCDISENEEECPLTTNQIYRIRKLTPKECWRLMGFSDEDFHKAAEVNSNTQLYKQAGNSICKNVLVAIFGQLFEGKENVYKEIG